MNCIINDKLDINILENEKRKEGIYHYKLLENIIERLKRIEEKIDYNVLSNDDMYSYLI